MAAAAPLARALEERLVGPDPVRVGEVTVPAGSPVQAAYARRHFEPAWQAPGRIGELAGLLEAAAGEGLLPGDYATDRLRQLAAVAVRTPSEAVEEDLLATYVFARYLRDRRHGKLDPSNQQPAGWSDPGIAAALDRALAGAALVPLVTEPETIRPGYRAIRDELAAWRRLAAGGDWPAIPPGPAPRPGERDPRVIALRERLIATRDLAANGAPADPALLDAGLAAALQAFQSRHGLTPDGRPGPATLRALNVSPETRVGQLRVALERLRWFPADSGELHVLVNVPEFMAGVRRDGEWLWRGRVIVGRPRRPTPVMTADIRGILLNPSWRVPPTILREDVLPEVRRDPGYLARQGLQVVTRDGRPLDAAGIAGMDWRHFDRARYLIVQPPGPTNPLGRLRFLSPNSHDVYLHDTPAQKLFARDVRAFSSGCIRIEDPLRVAELLLDDPGQDRPALEARIAPGHTETVPLRHPVRLQVVYWTVALQPSGAVGFFRDLYDLDGRVLAGLDNQPLPPVRRPRVAPVALRQE